MIHLAANYIFTGKKLLKNAYISVDKKGKILFVSKENGALVEKEKMIFYNGIISPAFVNTHCHIELSGLHQKVKLQNGLTEFIKSISKLKKEQQYSDIKNIKDADVSMYNNGIQAVGDVMNEFHSIGIKKNSKIYYHNFIELYEIDNKKVQGKIKIANILSEKLDESGLKYSIVPHSFYSICSDLLNFIKNKNSQVLSIHFLESQEEIELYRNHSGKLYDVMKGIYNEYMPVVNTIRDLSKLIYEFKEKSKRIILVHNVELESQTLEPDDNLFLCLCPNSNLKIHNKLPNKGLINNNYNFVIGTDSLASNDKLCILSELRTIMHNYENVNMERILKWATYNGARAIGVDGKLGELKTDTMPGIILLENLDLPNLKFKSNSIVKRLF